MFPRIFMKISESEFSKYVCDGVVQRRLLIFRNGEMRVFNVGDNLRYVGGDVYVQEVYDDAYRWLVDFESGVILRDCIILPSEDADPIILRRGDKVYLMEAVGRSVHSFVSPSDEVYIGMRVAAIFTGKREVRYLRSSVKGRVVYVAQIGDKPQRYIFIIIPFRVCGE